MTSLYLEHYLESLDSLPGELRRNFTLMHDLDEKNRNILRKVDEASDEYLRKVRELSPDQRRNEMQKIQKMFKKAKEHGDEKVSVAIQTYEMVDKHIRRLDADLARFEAEMREKGRLSQTETEDEEEEDTGDTTKKRGRKKASTVAKDKAGSIGKKKKASIGSTNSKANTAATEEDKLVVGRKKGKKAGGGGGGGATSDTTQSASLTNNRLPFAPQEIVDMPVDPNEPTYCLCQQVSYGEMIGCDNTECPIEWFHFGCMGLTSKPKGKWYCPKCLPLFKKKKL